MPIRELRLIDGLCRLAGRPDFLRSLCQELAPVAAAVERHDSARLYDWLMDAFSFQGVADAAASAYLARHGNATFDDVAATLASRPHCHKLARFDGFVGCLYQKTAASCSRPELIEHCPLPKLPLRNGQLNQIAYSLFLFIRDEAEGDLVAYIDRCLHGVDLPNHPDRIARQRQVLLARFGRIHGVSGKVLSMSLADLLLAGSSGRPDWLAVGSSLVAVDRLVHNFLHRTGLLKDHYADHGYGPACYREGSCAAIIDRLARLIDARAYDPDFPPYFPRFVQHTIWRYCAAGGLDICNGHRIDDRRRCRNTACVLFADCSRIALKPADTEITAAPIPRVETVS